MDITDFSTITFDCYGTLIDWEIGILAELRPWAERNGMIVDDDMLLENFGILEAQHQHFLPRTLYPDILAEVHRDLARRFGVPVDDAAARAFGQSVARWPVFADTVDALRYLKQHYTLVILSNVDRASFAETAKKLAVSFDAILTAEDIGSYKPSPANFRVLIETLADIGVDKTQILHTAQSLAHDIAPATKAGLATCWIDRRFDKLGYGATKPPQPGTRPTFRFTSRTDMADRHRSLTTA